MAVEDNEVIRCVVNIALPDTVIAQNVYYYQLSDPTPDNPSNAQIVAAVGTAMTELYERIEPSIVTDATVLDVSVDKVEWDGTKWEVVEAIGLDTLAIVGDNVGDMAPHGNAAVITTNTTRPQSRGRKFFPGIAEGRFLGSDLVAALQTELAGALLEWITDRVVTGAAELIAVIVGQSGPSSGVIFPLVSGVVGLISGYQRRRKPGVGS